MNSTASSKLHLWRWHILLYGILILGILLTVLFKSQITGLAIFESTSTSQTWTFASGTGYSYDSSLLSFSPEGVTLRGQEQTTITTIIEENRFQLLAAWYHPKNNTDDLLAIDQKKLKKKDNILLDLFFSEPLAAGDSISLYIDSGDSGDSEGSGIIFACPLGTICTSEAYGRVSYDGGSGWYQLTLSTLPSSGSSVNGVSITTPQLDLQAINLSRGILVQAGYDAKNKISPLTAQDGSTFSFEENILQLLFNQSLAAGDEISLWVTETDGSSSTIILCSYGEKCAAPGLGSVSIGSGSSIPGWYNLTLRVSPSPAKAISLYLSNEAEMALDIVQARRLIQRQVSNTTFTYPSSATISTADFSPGGWSSWQHFFSQEQLGGGNISYAYSTDGGTVWAPVPTDGNLNSNLNSNFNDNLNGSFSDLHSPTLRFSANISFVNMTPSSSLPFLQSINVSYLRQNCLENWTVAYDACQIDGQQKKKYLDTHSCGTSTALPNDNGTAVACDYCAMENCTQAFSTRMHFSPNITIAVEAYTSINTSISTHLEIIPLEEGEVAVQVVEYANHSVPPPLGALALSRYFEIQTNATIAIQEVRITLQYTDQEIAAAGIAEDTLQMHYFNDSHSTWQALSSERNMTANTVTTTVPHFSFYTLYGTSSAESGSSSGSSGGDSSGGSGSGSSGGGGGGRSSSTSSGTSSGKEAPIFSQVSQSISTASEAISSEKKSSIPELERVCQYILEVTLPNTVDLTSQPEFTGNMLNSGNCPIDRLELTLEGALAEEVKIALSPPPEEASGERLGERLGEGNTRPFVLIRKQNVPEKSWMSTLTGSAVLSKPEPKDIEGLVTIQGHTIQGELLFEKQLPLIVIVPGEKYQLTSISKWMLLTLMSIGLLGSLWWWKKGKRIEKGKKRG